MNITDVSYKVDKIVNDLFISVDREQVEEVFTKNEVYDFEERIQLLRKCMKVLGTSNFNNTLSSEDEYHDELEIFLDGTWRFII